MLEEVKTSATILLLEHPSWFVTFICVIQSWNTMVLQYSGSNEATDRPPDSAHSQDLFPEAGLIPFV